MCECNCKDEINYREMFLELYDILNGIDRLSQIYCDRNEQFHLSTLHLIARRYMYKNEYDKLKSEGL